MKFLNRLITALIGVAVLAVLFTVLIIVLDTFSGAVAGGR